MSGLFKEASQYYFGEEPETEELSKQAEDNYDGGSTVPIASGIAGAAAGAMIPRMVTKNHAYLPFGTSALSGYFGYQAGKEGGKAISEKVRHGEVNPEIIDTLLLALGSGAGAVGGSVAATNLARKLDMPRTAYQFGGTVLGSAMGGGAAEVANQAREHLRHNTQEQDE